jgi:transposase
LDAASFTLKIDGHMDAITLPPPGQRRRRYSQEFKAQIVETCKHPGTSVAAIARMHDLNDNMVHRWIREAELDAAAVASGASVPASIKSNAVSPCASAPFVPVQVSAAPPERIHLELVKNGLNVRIDWPASQSPSCLQTLLTLLR